MPQIEIDFEVFKALTARRTSEDMTENAVIRQLLGLSSTPKFPLRSQAHPAPGDWIIKGVRLPEGTELRANYKGRTYLGRVARGALDLNGRSFDSVSAAAVSVTGTAVNGWKFWDFRFPGETQWRALNGLRKRN